MLAAHPYGERIAPLYGEWYSQAAEGFESENTEMLRAIERVSQATGGRGIWAIDRGGDRRKILIPLLDRRLRFVVRQDRETGTSCFRGGGGAEMPRAGGGRLVRDERGAGRGGGTGRRGASGPSSGGGPATESRLARLLEAA